MVGEALCLRLPIRSALKTTPTPPLVSRGADEVVSIVHLDQCVIDLGINFTELDSTRNWGESDDDRWGTCCLNDCYTCTVQGCDLVDPDSWSRGVDIVERSAYRDSRPCVALNRIASGTSHGLPRELDFGNIKSRVARNRGGSRNR